MNSSENIDTKGGANDMATEIPASWSREQYRSAISRSFLLTVLHPAKAVIDLEKAHDFLS